MYLDKAVNLRKPNFLPFSSGKNNNICSDRVNMKNQRANLNPEFILELVTSVESFALEVVVSACMGSQDLGFPCPLSSTPIYACPLLGIAPPIGIFRYSSGGPLPIF